MYRFSTPEKKKVRVIINSDAKNEADDQYAIVHALLTPLFDIKGIIGAHYGQPGSADESVKECHKVLELMDIDNVNVFRGAGASIKSKTEFEISEGSELIVREAMRENPLPLFVVFLGPITDLACALLSNPDIESKLTAIWIGGGKYPDGGFEYNLYNDIVAANIVMESNVDLWQVPSNVYSQMLVSLSELEDRVYPYGKIGEYLFTQLDEFNMSRENQPIWPVGEVWSLGDSPAIGLILHSQDYAWENETAPHIDDKMTYSFSEGSRKIRVYKDINSRFILEDFFAKLKLNYPIKHN
jgi:inosine-uridine nucleoside N-ribohydrolase